VVYANTISKTETNEQGEDVEREIPFMKGYTVFNVEQIEALPEHFYAKPDAPKASVPPIERAEEFLAATGASVVHGGSRACYVQRTDNIHMPCIDVFRDSVSYYVTRAHETVHWTMHPTRLAREFGRKRFGDEGYAMEELVAELGSAFLCADLELTPELRADHASYIDSWIKVLKNDKRAIFTAASHAERAAAYLHGLQDKGAQRAA
jgi:antirestriction protein ArdC